jgi:hypothetical protein
MASLAIPFLSVARRPTTNGNMSIIDVVVGKGEIVTGDAHVGDRRRLSSSRQFHLPQPRLRQFERWLMSARTSCGSKWASLRLDAKHKHRQERGGLGCLGCGGEDGLLVRLHDVQPMVEILLVVGARTADVPC